MKKFLVIISIMIVAALLALSGSLQNVTASSPQYIDPGQLPTATQAPQGGIAEGVWSGGTEMDLDPSDMEPPSNYLQLLGEVVKASSTESICHPFRGGQYGWTGSIYQLFLGRWIKVPTYFIWYPDREGTFMACVKANKDGVYALFGSYTEKINPTATPTRTPTQKPTTDSTRRYIW